MVKGMIFDVFVLLEQYTRYQETGVDDWKLDVSTASSCIQVHSWPRGLDPLEPFLVTFLHRVNPLSLL
jgi:hypothetical protein